MESAVQVEGQDGVERTIGRRALLRVGLGALLALGATPALARTTPLSSMSGRREEARSLAFDNVHTGEVLRATYWEKGRYLPDALEEINQLLRDYRTNEVCVVDLRLLDLLHTLRTTVGSRRNYQVISGYRSPATNETLLEEGRRVAGKSFHTMGMAIDIRLPDRRVSTVRRAAMRLGRGGVGYYPRSGFVHVDVGPVRHW